MRQQQQIFSHKTRLAASIIKRACVCQISNNLILARIRRPVDGNMGAILRTTRAAIHLNRDDGFTTRYNKSTDENNTP